MTVLPVLGLGLSLLALACSGSGRDAAGKPAPQNPPPPPPPAAAQPPAVAENLSFVAGVVASLDLVDEMRYILTLDVRTALPASPGVQSLVEPGQQIRALPFYDEGPGGEIALTTARNRRLHEVRAVPVGQPVLGRVQLGRDGTWYLLDTGMGDN